MRLAAEFRAGQILGPGKAGRQRRQFHRGFRIVHLFDIALLGLGPACLGDTGFQRHDVGGTRLCVGPCHQTKQCCDVTLITGLLFGEIGLQVIIAVGHAEARLVEQYCVVRHVLDVEIDISREETAAEIILAGAHQPRERRPIRLRNGFELGLDGREPKLLDGGFVHEGGIHRADLLAGRGRRAGLCRRFVFEQAVQSRFGAIANFGKGIDGGFVAGDRRVRYPCAIHVAVEIVLRPDRLIHAAHVQAERGIERRGRRGAGWKCQ